MGLNGGRAVEVVLRAPRAAHDALEAGAERDADAQLEVRGPYESERLGSAGARARKQSRHADRVALKHNAQLVEKLHEHRAARVRLHVSRRTLRADDNASVVEFEVECRALEACHYL